MTKQVLVGMKTVDSVGNEYINPEAAQAMIDEIADVKNSYANAKKLLIDWVEENEQ